MTISNLHSTLNTWWENSAFAPLLKNPNKQDFYFSPLSPRLAMEKDPEEVMFLQDGKVPLLYFFSCYTPTNLPQLVFIEKELAPFIPQEWLANTLFYSIYSNKSWSEQMSDLAPMTIFFHLKNQNTSSALEKIISILSKTAIQDQNIFLIFEKDFPHQLLLKLYQKYPLIQIKSCTHTEVPKICNPYLKNGPCLYVELNDKNIIADYYLKHYFLSQGAIFYSSTSDSKDFHEIKTYSLSPFHGVHIFEIPSQKKSYPYFEPTTSEQSSILMGLKTYELRSIAEENISPSYHPFFEKLLEQGLFIRHFDKLIRQARIELGIK